MRKSLVITLALIGAAIFIVVCGTVLLAVYYGIASTVDDIHWRDRTTPLDDSVRQDLCEKFELPGDDPRCTAGAVVYAPEFFATIQKTFLSDPQNPTTFDQVQNRLGEYMFDREPITKVSNGIEYYRCWYDLRGDRVYPIVIFFYSDDTLWKIIASTTD